MIKRIRYLILAFAFPIWFAGCAEEPDGWETGEDALLIFNLSLPQVDGGGNTRALTADDENYIADDEKYFPIRKAFKILAFVKFGDIWMYHHNPESFEVTYPESGITQIYTRVVLLHREQFFVIIANDKEKAPGKRATLEEIEQSLISSGGDGEWPARNNGTGPFSPIPMYARTTPFILNPTENKLYDIHMIRMLARINVTLKSGINNFTLKEACLFNHKSKGYVTYGYSDFNGTTVTKPAVPPGGNPTGNTIREPRVFYQSDTSIDQRGAILNSIYTFESPAITSEADRYKGTALVVGGKYNGSSDITYYRIDLKTTDDTSNNISSNILRNHSYDVEIQQVTSGGYATALDAYLGFSRLTAKVTDWNEIGQKVGADKEYYLNVSETSVKLSGTDAYTIKAETDYTFDTQGYPAGIRIGAITYSASVNGTYAPPASSSSTYDWLQVTKSGTTNATVTFKAKATSTSGGRYAKVELCAGNFTRIINVQR